MAEEQSKRIQRLIDKLRILLGETYEDICFLDEGGMGAVFTGRHKRLGRTDAIKVLFADAGIGALDRFKAEWQTIAALGRSPYIISIYEADESEEHNLAWLAEEFIDGESLLVRLGRGKMPRAEAVPLATQIARGLEFAHDRNIIHRDVKPANVLIDKSTGEAVLTDFGLARFVGDDRLTQTNMAVGTLAYMSPESLSGAEPAPASDVYSLGVVLYEMFTGRRLFEGPDVIQKQLTRPAPDPREAAPDLPGPLATLVLSMLSKEPEKRPTMKAVRETLESTTLTVAEDDPTLAGGVGVAGKAGSKRAGSGAPGGSGRKVGTLAAVIVGLAVVAGVIGWGSGLFGSGPFGGGEIGSGESGGRKPEQANRALADTAAADSGAGNRASLTDIEPFVGDTTAMAANMPDQNTGADGRVGDEAGEMKTGTDRVPRTVDETGAENDPGTGDDTGNAVPQENKDPIRDDPPAKSESITRIPEKVAFRVGVTGSYRSQAQRFQILVNGRDTGLVGPQTIVWDRPANGMVSVALRQVGFVFSPAETTISFSSAADTTRLLFGADRR